MDDVLIGGEADNPQFKKAMSDLKKSFNFGKWDQLSPSNPIKYCGGIIEFKDGVAQTSYEEVRQEDLPDDREKREKPT